MFRPCLATVLFALIAATAAPAHFVFLIPVDATKGKAVFSDTLKPDDKGVPVERIAGTKLTLIDGGEATDLAWTHDKAANCYTFEVPGTGTRIVVGTTDYGVSQRGESKPMWLRYYPKAVFGDIPAPEKATVGDKAPVELVPIVDGGKLRFNALAGGKPMAKAEVTVLVPGEEKGKVFATDVNGLTEGFDKSGLYGAQVRLVEEKSGEVGGKKYEEVRQYATLVVSFGK